MKHSASLMEKLLSVPTLYRFYRSSFGPKRARALVIHRILRAALDDRYLGIARLTWLRSEQYEAPSSPFLMNPLSEEEIAWFRSRTGREQFYRETAEQICLNAFSTPGTGLVEWGWPVRWHQDVRSGYEWPVHPYPVYRKLPPPGRGIDIQIPWALSRGYHLVALAQGWVLTGEDRYAEKCFLYWEHWVEANPPGHGIHWASTLEVAIRMLHWTWAFSLLEKAPGWTSERVSLLFNLLQIHGRHVEHNLEVSVRQSRIVAANHYLGSVSALCCLGMLCPQIPFAARWLESGWKALEREIQRQVLRDGVHFEAATGYHCLALEMFILPALIARRQNRELPRGYHERLKEMLAVLPFLRSPDHSLVKLGDDDNGRFLALGGIAPQQRRLENLLTSGRILAGLDNSKPPSKDSPDELFWIMGRKAVQTCLETPSVENPQKICHFRNAGWFLVQHEKVYLALRSRPPAAEDSAHAHSDLLSMELWLEGIPVIQDPGTGSYTGDPVLRNLLRSSRSHNTVLVDGCEIIPFDPDDLFGLESTNVEARVLEEEIRADGLLIEIEHNAFKRLEDPVSHRRSIHCDTGSPTVTVYDHLAGVRNHEALWCWNFHPGREVLGIERMPSHVSLDLSGVVLETRVRDGEFVAAEVVSTIASPRYGQVTDTSRLEARVEFQKEITVETRFLIRQDKQNCRPASAQK